MIAKTVLNPEALAGFQAELDALRLEVLNGLIEELLVEQRIREIGLTVTDQELDSAIDDVQRQNKLTGAQLEAAHASLLSQQATQKAKAVDLRRWEAGLLQREENLKLLLSSPPYVDLAERLGARVLAAQQNRKRRW